MRFDERELRRIYSLSPLPEPPKDETNRVADDPAAARLGQFLFFDVQLSGNGKVSCATCHDPARSFTDGKALAETIGRSDRHTPSLWNVANNRWYFWDGRADTLWAQALQPFENDVEMGGDRLSVARRVLGDAALRKQYEALFGPAPDLSDAQRFPARAKPVAGKADDPRDAAWRGMSEADRGAVNRVFANVGKALAAYERKLISRRAPFDVFVEGLRENDEKKQAALSPAAQRGLALFVGKANCRFCHHGPNLTDGEFHDTRIPPFEGGVARDPSRARGIERVLSDPFNAAGAYSDAPRGAAAEKLEVLKRGPESAGQFKTPSLRNVARTGPYMHQGQLEELRQVVRFYSTMEGAAPPGHHQEQFLQPLNLTDREIDDLVAFLHSLTDEAIDPALIRAPGRDGAGKRER